jgi:signal transduction histidine kinase/ActR/RegA family two-component response regulator
VKLLAPARIVRAYLTRPRLLNALYGGAIIAATTVLFAIDISEPRGVVDGVGYAAVVALTSRFGRRALIGIAAITSVLTILAAGLLPDAGISVAGMWANRTFALAEIWIVALVMRSRMDLEARIREREDNLRRHETALATMVQECLLANISFDERLRLVCQTSCQALGVEAGVITLRNDDNKTTTVLHSWRKFSNRPVLPRGTVVAEDPQHKARLAAEFVVATDDVALADIGPSMKKIVRDVGIRATLVAEAFLGSPRNGTIFFGREQPCSWSGDEIAFVRAIASFVAVLISGQRNAETLAALELTDDGIYTEDASGKVQYSNRAAQMFSRHLPEGDEFPRPPSPLVTSQDQHEIHYEGRDLEIHRARLPTGGQIVRLADMTERNQVMAERARLEDRLQRADKLEAIGQLASGMAHDFNNILGAVSGFAGFISQDTATDSQNRDFAQRILSASKRGKDMVDQIMAFAETRTVTQGVANLGRTIQASRELLASTMHPGAMLEVELPEAPLLVRGNEVQIGQLIANLAANGRDALNGTGGLVEITAGVASDSLIKKLCDFSNVANERLVGEPKPARRYARLSVSDSGSGISPTILDRIFEPFFSTKGRQRGTGLGLAVVHGVVRSHDGFCHVRSDAGKGTVFSIYLPLIEGSADGPPYDRQLNPCRVLIVDDEADMADMLSIGLERLGFQTVAVQSPMVALAAIEEDPSAFDTLLTDQLMPVMRGMELIREAKRVAPALRAVLCTAHAEKMSEAEALDLGADAVIYKPVEIQAVAEAVGGTVPGPKSAMTPNALGKF